MRASSDGFLPNTRSVCGIGKMDRKGQICGRAICHKIQEEEEE